MINLPRRIIIGDVHGQFYALMRLIELLNLTPNDSLYFVGDLIDRGPDSAKVLDYVMSRGLNCVCGNHEFLMHQALLGDFEDSKNWIMQGGGATVESLGGVAGLRVCYSSIIQWLRELPDFLDLGDLLLVHAGIRPKITIEHQDPHDLKWIRWDFLNYPEILISNKTIVCGHTPTVALGAENGAVVFGPSWIDIDTGAGHPKGQWLTGLDWDRRWIYQVQITTLEMRNGPMEEMMVNYRGKGKIAKLPAYT